MAAPKSMTASPLQPTLNTITTLHTVAGAGAVAELGKIWVANPSTTTDGTFEIWAYQNGGSATDATKLVPERTVPFGQFTVIDLAGLPLNASGLVQVRCKGVQLTFHGGVLEG